MTHSANPWMTSVAFATQSPTLIHTDLVTVAVGRQPSKLVKTSIGGKEWNDEDEDSKMKAWVKGKQGSYRAWPQPGASPAQCTRSRTLKHQAWSNEIAGRDHPSGCAHYGSSKPWVTFSEVKSSMVSVGLSIPVPDPAKCWLAKEQNSSNALGPQGLGVSKSQLSNCEPWVCITFLVGYEGAGQDNSFYSVNWVNILGEAGCQGWDAFAHLQCVTHSHLQYWDHWQHELIFCFIIEG